VAPGRFSTQQQGRSGLGLEAQKAAVVTQAAAMGCKIIAEYTEIETGKGRGEDRPELAKALAHARFAKATLVIAKMDRLTRNLGFLTRLEDAQVDFCACDLPHASKLTVRIMVMVAEQEAEAISTRTRAALAAYRARGGELGASLPQCRNLTDDGRKLGARNAGCQWTRIVTRLVNPNCYEARPSPDRAASSRTALESPWFPGRSCTSLRALLVPATPNRGL
jgi:DNA invertase Pin-like site-specific DNA recombinase